MFEILSTVPHCQLYGKPVLVLTHLIGDIGTFAAYMAIPLAIEIVRKQRGLKFDRLAALFSMFIFLCGFGHLLNVGSMFVGGAWLNIEGANKLLTGLVSLITAVYIFRLIPVLKTVPTPREYNNLKEDFEQAARALDLQKQTKFWQGLTH